MIHNNVIALDNMKCVKSLSVWLSLYVFSLPQIPEEEKNLGPQDRLIHVYHFTKDTAQNQMVNLA